MFKELIGEISEKKAFESLNRLSILQMTLAGRQFWNLYLEEYGVPERQILGISGTNVPPAAEMSEIEFIEKNLSLKFGFKRPIITFKFCRKVRLLHKVYRYAVLSELMTLAWSAIDDKEVKDFFYDLVGRVQN